MIFFYSNYKDQRWIQPGLSISGGAEEPKKIRRRWLAVGIKNGWGGVERAISNKVYYNIYFKLKPCEMLSH